MWIQKSTKNDAVSVFDGIEQMKLLYQNRKCRTKAKFWLMQKQGCTDNSRTNVTVVQKGLPTKMSSCSSG